MSGVAAKPLLRFTSLVRRKDKQETPYQTWEEEDDSEEDCPDGPTSERSPGGETTNPVVEFTAIVASSPEPFPETDNGLQRQGSLSRRKRLEADELLECFYIGSYDMTGLAIRGRGCINLPASVIWQHSQDQERKPRRVGSWSGRQQHCSTGRRTSVGGVKPRYVKLVTGADKLHVQDQSSEDVVMVFTYRKISFVGTHPKYNRLFAFIAEAPNISTPYCHAFKCEDSTSAKKAANMLSDVFQKKIEELVIQAAKKEASTSGALS